MDDLTLIRSFRAECADGDPRARAAAWRALEARLGPALPTSATDPGRSPRRRLLALAGGGALAALAAAGFLALSSGPAAQPAAAEVLRHAAAAAVAGSPSESQPGPGQYLYTKTRAVEFEGWISHGLVVPNGPVTSQPGGFSALLPIDREVWMSPGGGDRERETMGTPRFLSSAEQSRWEQAGSPLPVPFGLSPQEAAQGKAEVGGHLLSIGGHVIELRRGVVDIEHPKPEGGSSSQLYPDLSSVPTDPEALRLAVEDHQVPGVADEPGKPLDTEETIEALGEILSRPNASPALRAAAFDALAELPGVELDRNATDLVGRSGYAIGYTDRYGQRGEFIFDPETSMALGERTVLADPGQEPQWRGYPAGLTIRDVAFLQSEVVDSMPEPAEEAEP